MPDSTRATADPRAARGTRGSLRGSLRVYVVDDDPQARMALEWALADDEDVRVLGGAALAGAATEVGACSPDIVLLDVDARTRARAVIRDIRVASPRTRLLVVSAIADPAAALEAFLAGACGYVGKGQSPGQLRQAVHEAMDGRVPLGEDLVGATRERLARPAPVARAVVVETPLTDRERTVLRHVAEGLTNEQIAGRLVLSPGTVKLHVQHIIAKLEVANRTQAAVVAARIGLLSDAG